MTFAIFIVLVLGVFVTLLNILPAVTAFSLPIGSSIITIIGYMKAWNFLIPIQELLIVILVIISFEIAIWTWHVLWKVIKFLRGSSDGA